MEQEINEKAVLVRETMGQLARIWYPELAEGLVVTDTVIVLEALAENMSSVVAMLTTADPDRTLGLLAVAEAKAKRLAADEYEGLT